MFCFQRKKMCFSDLFKEKNRLKTYKCWKLPFISKNELAMYGMYFCGVGDKVKCVFCEVEIGKVVKFLTLLSCNNYLFFLECWERSDRPFEEHLRHSPFCDLLNGRYTRNVAINEAALRRRLPPNRLATGYWSKPADCQKGFDIPDRFGDSFETYQKWLADQRKKNCINTSE